MSETTRRPLKRLGLLSSLDLPAPSSDPSVADAPTDHAITPGDQATAEPLRDVQTPGHPSDTTRRTSVYLSAAMLRRLKELAVARDCKVNDLLVEGAASVLRENGHTPPTTSRDML
ncbi:hypothetical protein MKK70_12970 [Methylobacterium sp. E-041]|uniref:hypothetical protein n=1 Tax=Methylobacterium sp. E-041 TaxID=2836573 RepID=UPI001FBBA05B|nr:hypothetical protein [Methylobacterium sp. E-041]MCJ2106274.1 hypothetical protein [Methylobacterium sp. E-041]